MPDPGGGLFFPGGGIFTLFFLFFFGIIAFAIIRSISQWRSNNQQPVLTVEAVLVSKRQHTTHHANTTANGGVIHSDHTSYYVTFEVESGDRMELRVSGPEYGRLAERDAGRLTFQGTRYLGFERFR